MAGSRPGRCQCPPQERSTQSPRRATRRWALSVLGLQTGSRQDRTKFARHRPEIDRVQAKFGPAHVCSSPRLSPAKFERGQARCESGRTHPAPSLVQRAQPNLAHPTPTLVDPPDLAHLGQSVLELAQHLVTPATNLTEISFSRKVGDRASDVRPHTPALSACLAGGGGGQKALPVGRVAQDVGRGLGLWRRQRAARPRRRWE